MGSASPWECPAGSGAPRWVPALSFPTILIPGSSLTPGVRSTGPTNKEAVTGCGGGAALQEQQEKDKNWIKTIPWLCQTPALTLMAPPAGECPRLSRDPTLAWAFSLKFSFWFSILTSPPPAGTGSRAEFGEAPSSPTQVFPSQPHPRATGDPLEQGQDKFHIHWLSLSPGKVWFQTGRPKLVISSHASKQGPGECCTCRQAGEILPGSAPEAASSPRGVKCHPHHPSLVPFQG